MFEFPAIPAEQRPLHVLNRLGFGPRPGDLETVARIGVEHWIRQQLDPDSIPQAPEVDRRVAELPTLRMTPVDLFVKYQLPLQQIPKDDKDARKMVRQESRVTVEEAVEARIMRAVASRQQLLEVMTAFWFNHFNVFAGKGLCRLWVGAYEEEAIRPHALGRFRDLLGATARHPAMLFYLDNWQNTAPDAPGRHGKFEGINENYARELMELHTLGVNGGYTQQDVIALAHILTGWGIIRRDAATRLGAAPGMFRQRRIGFAPFWRLRQQRAQRWPGQGAVRSRDGFFFDPSRHDFAAQALLRQAISSGGIKQGEEALDLLARSPATANHLSFQLAQYFVADDPPPALVERMADRYLETDGRIRDVLEIMFASPEFWDRRFYAAKYKTPYEFVISAVRASGSPVLNVRPLAGTMAFLGMPLYGCQTPDGYKNTQAAWLNPESMMTRLNFATALGAGRLPLRRPVFASPADDTTPEPKRMQRIAATARKPDDHADGRMEPPDPVQLVLTLGDMFSTRTAAAVESAPPQLRAPLILGSPEFMMR